MKRIIFLSLALALGNSTQALMAVEAVTKTAATGHEGHDHAEKKDDHKDEKAHEGHDHAKEKAGHKDEHGHEDHAEEKGDHKDEKAHEGHDHAKEKAGHKDEHGHEDHAEEKGDHKDEKAHEGHGHAKEKAGHKDEHGHEGGEHEEANPNVGPGKAVEAFAEGGKLKLSVAAIKRLELKSAMFKAGSEIPRVALVQSEGKSYVFVDKGERSYERRAVQLGSASGKSVQIKTGLRSGEKVVTSGASSLRVAELDLMAGDEAGHDH